MAANLRIFDTDQLKMRCINNDRSIGIECSDKVSKIVDTSQGNSFQKDINSIDKDVVGVKEKVSIEIKEELEKRRKSLVEEKRQLVDYFDFISNENDMTIMCKKFDEIIDVNEEDKSELNDNLNVNGNEIDNIENTQTDELASKSVIRQDENLYCNKCNNMKTVNVECPCILNVNISDSETKICDGIDLTKCGIRDGIDVTKSGIRDGIDGIDVTKCVIRDGTDGIDVTKCGINGGSEGITDITAGIKYALKGVRDCVREISSVGCMKVDDSGVSDKMNSSASRISGRVNSICDSGIRNSIERIRYDVRTDDGVASVDLSSAIALINR